MTRFGCPTQRAFKRVVVETRTADVECTLFQFLCVVGLSRIWIEVLLRKKLASSKSNNTCAKRVSGAHQPPRVLGWRGTA